MDLSNWIRAPADCDAELDARFKEFETAERDLKRIYSVRSAACPSGIMHFVESNGIGEEEGENPLISRVFERVEGHLLKPIPETLQ